MSFKIIFAGTAEIGAPLLEALAKDSRFELPLVITQPDQPAGRKKELTPSPIKSASEKLGLRLFQPPSINSEESLQRIKEAEAETMLVFAYGQLLKQSVLDSPRHGCINIHASLLPKYRGASPIQASLLNGDTETGVSIMKMEKGMDSGAVFKKFAIAVEERDNAQTLHDKLAKLSAQVIPDALFSILQGHLTPLPQNHEKATYVSKIQKTDGLINWKDDSQKIENKVRAFFGWPSAYTYYKGKLLKVHQAKSHSADAPRNPGETFEAEGRIYVSCGKGALELIRVQPEGKGAQAIKDFLNGNRDFLGYNLAA